MDSPLDPWPQPGPRASLAPAATLFVWTAFVALASASGVFAMLDPEEYMALAAFAVLFALATSVVDRDLRSALARVRHPLGAALAMDTLVIVALLALGTATASPWASLPGALALLVALPLALVFHAAALRRPRLRKAPAASPGGKPAAT